MDRKMKREQFIQELRAAAKTAGLEFTLETDKGKGSHYTVSIGARRSIIKSGEINPGYAKQVRKQLGL